MLQDQLHITLWLMIHYHPCSKGWGLFVFGVDFRGSRRNRGQSNFTVCPITMNIYSKCVLVVANAKAHRENNGTRGLCVEYDLTTTNFCCFSSFRMFVCISVFSTMCLHIWTMCGENSNFLVNMWEWVLESIHVNVAE